MSASQKETHLAHLHMMSKKLITTIYGTKTHEPQLTQIGTVSSAYHQAKLPE
jgi:hypothetical protein